MQKSKFRNFPRDFAISISQMTSTVVFLYSSYTANIGQEQEQRRAEDLLNAKGIAFQSVDGALDENHAFRNQLFAVSGVRGKYPQVFIRSDSGIQYVGDWPKLEVLLTKIYVTSLLNRN